MSKQSRDRAREKWMRKNGLVRKGILIKPMIWERFKDYCLRESLPMYQEIEAAILDYLFFSE